MPALRDIQQAYLEYYESGELSTLLKLATNGESISQQARINIYKNTTFCSLHSALESTYAYILSLVGEDFFKQIARSFIAKNIPEVSCIDDWGGEFPEYLLEVGLKYKLPYLSDVAKLEWLLQLSYTAKGCEVLSAADVAKYSPEQLTSQQFKLCPAVQLFRSDFDVEAIVKIAGGEIDSADVNINKECYCVITRVLAPKLHWVGAETYNALKMLSEGRSLTEISESIMQLDFQDFLIFLIENQVLNRETRG